MVNNIITNAYPISPLLAKKVAIKDVQFDVKNVATSPIGASISSKHVINQPNTVLNQTEQLKYNKIIELLKFTKPTANSMGFAPVKQMDILLKNGKLLSKSNHDNSTTLDNIYNILTTPRADGLDSTTLITGILDVLTNPRIVTQTFGDIPDNVKQKISNSAYIDTELNLNSEDMDVYSSGTCPAASLEVNMADKYPAELSRWVSELSSKNKSIILNVKLSSICQNPLEAMQIIQLLEANVVDFSFDRVKIKVDLDNGAHARAYTQTKHWNKGERSVVDVLVQSGIMELGSQYTYNALNDTRGGKFSSNPKGLIEMEKTFVESVIKNKEITSVPYHYIDNEQNFVGYNCSLDKISKHITDTIDSGDDVILGYISTNHTEGIDKMPGYDPVVNGAPNKVINGHEVTFVDYYKDQNGKLVFVCIDTDDGSHEFVKYSEDEIIPLIHHGGYPAHIVEADIDEIMKKAYSDIA